MRVLGYKPNNEDGRQKRGYLKYLFLGSKASEKKKHSQVLALLCCLLHVLRIFTYYMNHTTSRLRLSKKTPCIILGSSYLKAESFPARHTILDGRHRFASVQPFNHGVQVFGSYQCTRVLAHKATYPRHAARVLHWTRKLVNTPLLHLHISGGPVSPIESEASYSHQNCSNSM